MQFKNGTSIFAVDGKLIGSIERVVLDPRTKAVTHLVIRQGFFFAEDKVLPIEFIATADEKAISLKETIGNLEELPHFEEINYVDTEDDVHTDSDPGSQARPLYAYPPLGMSWWAYPGYPGYWGYPSQPYETEQNIPDNTIALKEGALVISADDKHVGNIARVFVDERTTRATHLVISQGLLFKDKKLVPTSWVKEIQEDEIKLDVTSSYLDKLREYQD